ncbi:MAG: transporter substrate-binding domain-containing protein [Ardenticatenaceae bacterium]|nr:transporter substrate-binding domain-containing protein [Ardenticatenaceae bacterium]
MSEFGSKWPVGAGQAENHPSRNKLPFSPPVSPACYGFGRDGAGARPSGLPKSWPRRPALTQFWIGFRSFGQYAKNSLWFIAIFGMMLWQIGCSNADDSWERVQAAGVLRVGLDPTYPPFEVDEGGNLVGLDIDLARAIANDLGLDVQFVYFGYDGLYDALATDQVDVLISALVIIPEKTRDFSYSEPYFNAGEILIVPTDNNTIETMADLSGKTVAVELGSLGHVEATEWAKRVADLEIMTFSTADEAITAVQESTAHAALTDAISGRLFLRNHDDLKRLPESVTLEPFALVVRSEDEQLLDMLNQSLATLQQSGQLDQIEAKWLDP